MSEWHYFKRKYEGTVNWKFQCVRGGVEQWGWGWAGGSDQRKKNIHKRGVHSVFENIFQQ